MTKQLDNTMIRELSVDELDVVSGAKPMEEEATRYEGFELDLGLIHIYANNGCINVWLGNLSISACPGQPGGDLSVGFGHK